MAEVGGQIWCIFSQEMLDLSFATLAYFGVGQCRRSTRHLSPTTGPIPGDVRHGSLSVVSVEALLKDTKHFWLLYSGACALRQAHVHFSLETL